MSSDNLAMMEPASLKEYFLDFTQRDTIPAQVWILQVFHRWEYQYLLKSCDLTGMTARGTWRKSIPWSTFKQVRLVSTFGNCGSTIRGEMNICQGHLTMWQYHVTMWVKLSQIGVHQIKNHKKSQICSHEDRIHRIG